MNKQPLETEDRKTDSEISIDPEYLYDEMDSAESESDPGNRAVEQKEVHNSDLEVSKSKMMNSSRPRIVIAVIAMGIILIASTWLNRTLSSQYDSSLASLSIPLEEFPERIGNWQSTKLDVDPDIMEVLKPDDYLQRVYEHISGEKVVLWMNFSADSRDQFHYPTVCMTGNGWEEEEASRKRIACSDLPDSIQKQEVSMDASTNQLELLRMLFHKQPTSEQYVYYWYYMMGETPIDESMRELSKHTRWFLRGRRNASLTIEIFSQSERPDPELMDEFAAEVVKLLERHLPEHYDSSCEMGAGL